MSTISNLPNQHPRFSGPTAVISGPDVSGTDVSSTDFKSPDFSNTDFNSPDFSNTDFSNTAFNSTDFNSPKPTTRPRVTGLPDLTERIDDLDALIWAAARKTDDPQLAVARAREYADSVFIGLVLTVGTGAHQLNCSVPTADGPFTAGEDLRMDVATEIPAVTLPASGAERELSELFALAHVSGADATVILRSRPLLEPNADSGRPGYVVRGWRLAGGGTAPIDAAGMFAFCCSEASSGEPLPLDPNTRYVDAQVLAAPSGPG